MDNKISVSGSGRYDAKCLSPQSMLTGSLLSLANSVFIISVAVRALQPGTIFTSYFIIVSMAVSIAILFFLNYIIFRTYFNLLNVFMAAFFVFYAVHAITVINGTAIMTILPRWNFDVMNYSLIVSYFALVAAMNGYVFSSGDSLIRFFQRRKARTINQKKLKVAILVLIITSMVFFYLFSKSLGGIISALHNMGMLRISKEFLGKGLYYIPMVILGTVSTFLTFGLKKNSKIWLAVTLLYGLLATFVSAFRYTIAILLCGVLVIQHLRRPFKLRVKYLLMGFLAFILIGPLPFAFRGKYGQIKFTSLGEQIKYAVSYASAFRVSMVCDVLLHGNSILAVMAITSKMSDAGQYQYGYYSISSLAGLIPRAVWPGRPTIGAKLINNYFWPGKITDTGSPTVSSVGEAYWEGGIAGVGIVFFALGGLFKFLEQFRVKAASNLWVASAYALTLWFGSIYSHEAFLGTLATSLLYGVVLFVVYKLTTSPVKTVRQR
ncbi:MAG: oligosaccharide repeat unit polymerase [Sedimentisphaerales bacterium]|nr:oligosaccharide repeat unit polymerase [Sedimentisphaerales bacterium]